MGQLRPDFLCWVNGALLLKGEEKATDAGLKDAVAELQDKMSRAWVDGTVQQRQGGADDVPSPCMLAYAAAGSKLQVGGLGRCSKSNLKAMSRRCRRLSVYGMNRAFFSFLMLLRC